MLSIFSKKSCAGKNLTYNEKSKMIKIATTIKDSITMHVTLCKVFSGDFKTKINWNDVFACGDFGKCMFRKADFDLLIQSKNKKETLFELLYDSLALNYDKSKFLEYDKMYLLIIYGINSKFIRVPQNINDSMDCIIYKMDRDPYTGFGFTKSERGIPEYYVTIRQNSDYEGKVINKLGYFEDRDDLFPFSEFNIDVFEIDKNDFGLRKRIMSYNSEYFEDGEHLYTEFLIDD